MQAIGANGIIYVGSFDGKLYALKGVGNCPRDRDPYPPLNAHFFAAPPPTLLSSVELASIAALFGTCVAVFTTLLILSCYFPQNRKLQSCCNYVSLVCACRRRFHRPQPGTPLAGVRYHAKTLGCFAFKPNECSRHCSPQGCCFRLCNPIVQLDGGIFVQMEEIASPDLLAHPSLGFVTRDTSWSASSAVARGWLRLARTGHLGSLWSRVVGASAARHFLSGFAHLAYTAVGVFEGIVCLTGIQIGLVSARAGAAGAVPLLFIYAFALFASELARILLSSYNRSEARCACE